MARVLLISTYDLGRQPFGLASPAAWLRRAGHDVDAVDLARVPLADGTVRRADLVAWHLPMHTATRLALPVIERVRRLHPDAHLCAYGLYASLYGELLRTAGVHTVVGAEFEAALVAVADQLGTGAVVHAAGAPAPVAAVPAQSARRLPRLMFVTPDRRDLPPLAEYATLQLPDGTQRIVGTTDASRGCKHRCRHCPIVPVYNGQFRVVDPEVVLADIGEQIAAGAEHITFGDPDFFNGPTHAIRIVRSLASAFPGVTYDVTIKIEHLLKHRDLLPVLAGTGCALVTSAVETVDDRILEKLEKGHTRADFVEAAAACRAAGLTLVPTFVPFTPWTTLEGYLELLHTIVALDLVDHVAPIQLAIRLLVTSGSRLLELPDIAALVGPMDPVRLTYSWRHPDPRVDALQQALVQRVAGGRDRPRSEAFDSVWQLAHEHAGRVAPRRTDGAPPRATVPYLNEPWYC